MLKPKIALIILYCVLGLIVAALIYQIAIEKEFNSKIALRALVSIALCVSGIIKVSTGSGARIRNSALYEKEYSHILRRAFAEQGRTGCRKRLLDALNYYSRNQNEKAISICDSLIPSCVTDDDFCAVLTVKAVSCSSAGLTEAAIELYYEVLRHDNTFSTAWSNLGVLFKSQGKNLDAISCYRNAAKYDPQNALAYSNLANVYFAIGYYVPCIEEAKKALEIKGNVVQAMTALSAAYAAIGDDAECERYFQMAVQNGYNEAKLKDFINKIRSNAIDTEDLVPLNEAQEKALREVYTSTAIPMLRACIPADIGKSRFGGYPLGEAPRDKNGAPMRLLCALYCSEIRSVPNFPESGILQFYISETAGSYGLNREAPTAQENFRVIYTEDEELGENTDADIGNEADFPVKGSYKLQFVPAMRPITDSDFRFGETLKACFEKYGAELDEGVIFEAKNRYHSEGHRVGGYPYFAKEDPRASRRELEKYDTLLLQVDTHDGLIEIGKTGVMNFFISKENLKNKDFSDILYWWDDESGE